MEWNIGCGRGRSGEGKHQNFLLEFARFTQVVLPTSGGSGGPDPRTPLASYAADLISFLRYSTTNTGVPLESGLGVVQSH